MSVKEVLANMSIGQTKVFPIKKRSSVTATASRLKKAYGVQFRCETAADGLVVTRIPYDAPFMEITPECLCRSGFRWSGNSHNFRNYEYLTDKVRLSVMPARHRLVFNILRDDCSHDYGSVQVKTVGELQNYLDLLGVDLAIKF